MKEQIGAIVRAARRERKLSQEELAARVELAVQSLSKIERGQSLPSVPTLAALARELRLPIATFFEPEKKKVAAGRRRHAELQARLLLYAADLSEDALEIAVAQVKVLHERLTPAGAS